MNKEELQAKVSDAVKKHIVAEINKPVNESVALITAGVIGVLAVAGGFASVIAALKRSKTMESFLNEHLPNYERELEVTIRKFKYARTMKDIDDVERAVDQHIDKLEKAYKAIDQIKPEQKDGQGFRNAMRRYNTSTVKKELQIYITTLEAAFRAKTNQLRTEVDNRFDGLGGPAAYA